MVNPVLKECPFMVFLILVARSMPWRGVPKKFTKSLEARHITKTGGKTLARIYRLECQVPLQSVKEPLFGTKEAVSSTTLCIEAA